MGAVPCSCIRWIHNTILHYAAMLLVFTDQAAARGEELEEDVAARCEAIRARLVDEARKREVA